MTAYGTGAQIEPTIDEDPSLVPECPYCEKPLESIRSRRVTGSGSPTFRFGKRYVYACPSCSKLLGVTHRKGFWMG